MQRVPMPPRPDWQAKADADGFRFHTFDDGAYWDESGAYAFELNEIDDHLEPVTDEIYALCLAFVARAVSDDNVLDRLRIPKSVWPVIRDSWNRNEGSIYGRIDLCYDGLGPAKLLEFNADTPTSVFEAAYFQWGWLEDQIEAGVVPRDADQFNSIHEHLIAAFAALPATEPLHFACGRGSEEDRATVEYLQDCAIQGGHDTRFVYIEDLGADANGNLNNLLDEPVRWLFKLYPWEWLFEERYAHLLLTCDTNFIEPAWKAVLSNKGALAYLWEMFPDHPNLLPTYFEGDARCTELGGDYARKPLFAREGANISLFERGERRAHLSGPYGAEGYVHQALAALPKLRPRLHADRQLDRKRRVLRHWYS